MTTHVPEDATARLLLDGEAISKSLSRIAHEIIERTDEPGDLALVGIQSRGAPLASRLRRLVEERSGVALPVGALDITFHRDDVHVRDGGRPPGRQPVVRATSIPFPIEGITVVLVDDVLYTGRTIRAAIDALLEFGRPARVQLAVLVDRGHRELPIRPDLRRQEPPDRPRRADPGRARRDRRARRRVPRRRARGRRSWLSCELPAPPRRHLLSIADLEPRRRRTACSTRRDRSLRRSTAR